MLIIVNQHYWTTFTLILQNKLLKVECVYLKFRTICLLFCTVKNTRCLSDVKTKLIRNLKYFSLEAFLIDLNNERFSLSQDSSSETNTASVNQDASDLVNMFNPIIDRHAHCDPYQGKKIDYETNL